MKVLAFCNLIPNKRGAFEETLIYEGKLCRQRGDTLILGFAGEPILDVAIALRQEGVRWHIMPGWSDDNGNPHPWRFVGAALHLLAVEQPDVATVSFGNEIPALLVSLLSPLWGIRHLQWVWQQHQQIRDPGRLTRCFSRLRLLNLRFDHFVATYEAGRKSLLRRGIPNSKITVVRNSVADYSPHRAPGWLRRELGFSTETNVMVTTGSLIARKRIDFILRAFAVLNESLSPSSRGIAVHLLVLGSGPEHDKLKQLAGTLKIDRQVHFLGLRNDVREILAEATVYLHAALAETGTYAIIEAMAAGLPTVVTDAGAARYQIVQGETGYVLDPNDFKGYCDCLQQLVINPGLRRTFGQAARRRWELRYRLEEKNVGIFLPKGMKMKT